MFSSIFSSKEDFQTHIYRTKKLYFARGYPEKVVNNQIDKIVIDEDHFV